MIKEHPLDQKKITELELILIEQKKRADQKVRMKEIRRKKNMNKEYQVDQIRVAGQGVS